VGGSEFTTKAAHYRRIQQKSLLGDNAARNKIGFALVDWLYSESLTKSTKRALTKFRASD
jgi:hypothetical protein